MYEFYLSGWIGVVLMRGRRRAVIPGILAAAVRFTDDCEFGAIVRRLLLRAGYIRKTGENEYERC